MKILLAAAMAALFGVSALAYQQAGQKPAMHDTTAETYEHLATAIIEIRATENNLVKGILAHYHAMARRHLSAAAKATGADRKTRLEAAAAEITNIANEGNKRVQAVRQRLLRAGHHHHTDAETKDDYMFIDGKEKKALLGLARSVGQLGAKGSAGEVRQKLRALTSAFRKAIAPE